MAKPIWKTLRIPSLLTSIGASIGLLIGLTTTDASMSIYERYQHIGAFSTAGGVTGLAIDGFTGFTRKVLSQQENIYYGILKDGLANGGLDPDRFLLNYIELNYYNEGTHLTSSDKTKKISKNRGDGLSFIVKNIFPLVRRTLTQEQLRNHDFLIKLLHNLYGNFMDVNKGSMGFWQLILLNESQVHLLTQETIKKYNQSLVSTNQNLVSTNQNLLPETQVSPFQIEHSTESVIPKNRDLTEDER
jgi:hypothetical protein